MGVLQVPCHETTLQVYVSHLPGGYSLTGQTDLNKHVLASKTVRMVTEGAKEMEENKGPGGAGTVSGSDV